MNKLQLEYKILKIKIQEKLDILSINRKYKKEIKKLNKEMLINWEEFINKNKNKG